MRSALKKLVPTRLRPLARRVYYLPADTLDSLLNRRNPLTPPRGKANVGGGDFEKIGERAFRHFVDFGGLKPDHNVLDVGCGIGRMAVPLTRYLNGQSFYEGFDIVPTEIKWCQDNITPRFPNFRFQVADIRNKEYNWRGSVSASEYRFPYGDGSFDFVLLTSVFTHMLPREIDNYLGEIKRVLKPDGRCFATFFLLNPESLGLMRPGHSTINFRHDFGVYRLKDAQTPEEAIAYDEGFVHDLYRSHGLEIEEPVRYGFWSGRRSAPEFQDIVVGRKLS